MSWGDEERRMAVVTMCLVKSYVEKITNHSFDQILLCNGCGVPPLSAT